MTDAQPEPRILVVNAERATRAEKEPDRKSRGRNEKSAKMRENDAIQEIRHLARLQTHFEPHHFEAANLYWNKITGRLDLVQLQTTLIAFLIQKEEIESFLGDESNKPTRSVPEQDNKVEEALPHKAQFATIEDLKYLGRCKPVTNLGEVKFFAHTLPKQLFSATTESRQMAREMLAVILLEMCCAHGRQATLNFLTDELAEFLYPELKGKLIN